MPMIVVMRSGEYDASRIWTAWELAGDGWWNEAGFLAVVHPHGTMGWEVVAAAGYSARVERLEVTADGLRARRRYLHPDTPMRLIPGEAGLSRHSILEIRHISAEEAP